ncbi:hypothetical protein AAFC00_005281 [Neodothiora populina]|uniref:SUI1 domain-containing protein n=1 Tax=Neodothiora populina TaxID=2781224 RepID=A0ABR3PKD7_9PEZI
MFKKKPTVKPLAPLRSSDRRRTADQIIAEYDLRPSAGQDDSLSAEEQKAAATAQLSSLRNSLLPDNVQSARFTTTHGPDLKQVSGTVYVGIHPGEEQRVLWFKMEDCMYPTVYTLWRNPGIVPLLLTPGVVVKKLQGGADLMTPGLANGPPFPEKAKKGAVVAVASIESPSVPVVVGRCEIDVSALGEVYGSKGHAVQTVHWAGDEIWAYSTSGKAGQSTPDHIIGWWDEDDEDEALANRAAGATLDDKDGGGVALDEAPVSVKGTGEDIAADEESDTASQIPPLTTKEIDDAFRKAFLYGIHHHMTTNSKQPNYGIVFPLSQSHVMANFVQPFLPGYMPEQANQLQIKKTSYKNIRKFIKSLDKEKMIRSKERDGNETTIIDIDFDDKAIKDFKPYRLPRKDTSGASSSKAAAPDNSTTASAAATAATQGGADESLGQKLERKEFYKPRDRLLPLFPSTTTPSTLFTAAEIKSHITTYIESQSLVSTTNKRQIKLDAHLANAVFDGTSPLDKEVLAKGTVPRDALFDRVLAACAPHYAITRVSPKNDSFSSTTTTKPKPGSPPRIRITTETRSGNKTATRVSGLEAYHISAQPLADELRKACAGATSVEPLVGGNQKGKAPVMEIMVQGPQRDVVLKALERRGVRGQWVEVVDKTKKAKR